MQANRREFLKVGTVGTVGAVAFGTTAVRAQLPDTARIVVGFPAGSSVDLLARAIARQISGAYMKTVIVENKAGAAGQIGAVAVKTAAPDGTTILIAPMTMFGVYPHTYKTLPYDPVADFTPVSMAVSYNFGLAVGSSVPASVTTLSQLASWYEATPARRNIGNPAVGSTLHFAAMLYAKSAGLDLQQVPYVGASMFSDLASQNLSACVSTLGSLLPLHKDGRLRILATSGEERSPYAPDVPTFVESGFKDLVFREWMGLFLPARTPADIVQRLNAAVRAALASRDVRDMLPVQAQEATPSSPEELAASVRREIELWGQRVRAVGFTAQS